MPLGGTFWGNLGLAALWHDMSEFTDGLNNGVASDGFREFFVGPLEIYQEPYALGGDGSRVQDNPGYDSGFFYAVETSSAEVIKCMSCFGVGVASKAFADNAQWVRLEPSHYKKDLLPLSPANPTGTQSAFNKNPVYKTGFVHNENTGSTGDVPYQSGGYSVALLIAMENVVGTWRLHQYNPYAWSGTPPEVVASAAMHAGVPADYIDQDAFDDAHDAYDLSTGDSPWSDLDIRWTIYARRLTGTKVSDFLIDCMNHGRDLIFVNEAGKLSTSSWTRPSHGVTGFTASGDQIINALSHTSTIKHIFNSVKCSWGEAVRESWEDTNGYAGPRPGSTEASVSSEPTLGTRPAGKWVDEEEDSDSISRFGRIWLKGKEYISNFRGQPMAVEVSHYPYLLMPHVDLGTGLSGTTWDKSADGGGMIHVTNWLASDAKPRAEIEIRQGPMGFDTGIGDLIEDLEITGDGRTIAEARIIERTYNFDTLTIDSLIMEIPPNT